MLVWRKAARLIASHGACTLVTVIGARGSVPREIGTRMLVAPDGSFHGTIGGGTLEWQALAAAQGSVAEDEGPTLRDYPLGPKLGQCCGGHVTLAYQRFDDAERCLTWAALEEADGLSLHFVPGGPVSIDQPGHTALLPDGSIRQSFSDSRTPLLLFGAGHVGRALVLALAPLPFRVTWIDQRSDAFPAHVPATTRTISVENPIDALSTGLVQDQERCFVLIMTHSHALDLSLTDAALRRGDCAYVGLIGSDTKRARFASRLRTAGVTEAQLDTLHCPIGLSGLRDKHPAVIAASVAADLLIRREGAANSIADEGRLARHV